MFLGGLWVDGRLKGDLQQSKIMFLDEWMVVGNFKFCLQFKKMVHFSAENQTPKGQVFRHFRFLDINCVVKKYVT